MVTKERMEQMLDRMAEAATGYLETDEGDRYRAKSIAEAKSEILGEMFPDDSINGVIQSAEEIRGDDGCYILYRLECPVCHNELKIDPFRAHLCQCGREWHVESRAVGIATESTVPSPLARKS